MRIIDLGTIKYGRALEIQEDLLSGRIAGEIPDTLLMLEHEPVITLGRTSDEASILDRGYFRDNGIEVVRTSRGGKVTYHGPGQLVFYPIVDLGGIKRDVSFYIDLLEESVASSLRRLGVPAVADSRRRGVWVDGLKIAFIGVKVRRWVTWHGVAVNINNDIEPFSRINPCGESDIRVTSAGRCLGRDVDIREAKEIFSEEFGTVFAGAGEALSACG